MKRFFHSIVMMLIFSFGAYAQWGVNSSSTNFRPTTNVSFEETALPLVYLKVDGQIIQKESKILAQMTIIDNKNGHNYRDTIAHPDQRKDYQGYIALKYRGNSSFYNSRKKPFSVRPLTAADVNAKKDKVVMLGMGKKGDNDWCLLAPWEDRSYVRDLLTFELARPYFDYTPQGKYCEVIVDGVYYGVYMLTERPTKGKDRLALDDPGEYDSDLSGDYHVCVDRDDEEHYYQSKYHPLDGNGNELRNKYITYQYKDFEYDDFMDADYLAKYPHAIDSLHKYIDQMEDVLKSDYYTDPVRGYRAYIDVQSFVDYQLSTEFTNNIDGYRLSTNLYKYSNKHAAKKGLDHRWKTALWDFNIAYGNVSYYNPTGDIWRYKANGLMANNDNQLIPFWWERLMSDPQYVKELKARWEEYRSGAYSEANIEEKIDSMVSVLKNSGALQRDNQAWSSQFGSIDYQISTLKNFITARLTFLDKELNYGTGGDNPGGDESSATVPVEIKSGYNLDVLCENAGDVAGTTTQSSVERYQGLDKSSFVMYTDNVRQQGALCGTDGKITSAKAEYLVHVDRENALALKDISGGLLSGTLVLAQPASTDKIYLLGTSCDGASSLEVVLNYTDGTSSSANNYDVSDWSTQGGAVSGLGRMVGINGSWAGSLGYIPNQYVFNLFEMEAPADESKSVSSITITRKGSNCPSVMCVSMNKVAGSGIGDVKVAPTRYIVAIYSLDGINLPELRKGMNIVKYSDGSVEKIYLK